MNEYVLRGVALLDSEVPGWRERIDPDQLFLHDCYQCILGQLFGGFFLGLNALGLEIEQSWYYGFENDGFHKYSDLTKLWKEQL